MYARFTFAAKKGFHLESCEADDEKSPAIYIGINSS